MKKMNVVFLLAALTLTMAYAGGTPQQGNKASMKPALLVIDVQN